MANMAYNKITIPDPKDRDRIFSFVKNDKEDLLIDFAKIRPLAKDEKRIATDLSPRNAHMEDDGSLVFLTKYAPSMIPTDLLLLFPDIEMYMLFTYDEYADTVEEWLNDGEGTLALTITSSDGSKKVRTEDPFALAAAHPDLPKPQER